MWRPHFAVYGVIGMRSLILLCTSCPRLQSVQRALRRTAYGVLDYAQSGLIAAVFIFKVQKNYQPTLLELDEAVWFCLSMVFF